MSSVTKPLQRKSRLPGRNSTANTSTFHKNPMGSVPFTPIRAGPNHYLTSSTPMAKQRPGAVTPRGKENPSKQNIFASFNTTLNNSHNVSGREDILDFPAPPPALSKVELKDDATQRSHVEQLVVFLAEIGFPKLLTVSEFCPPTSSGVYFQVWEFLHRYNIDQSFSFEKESQSQPTGHRKTMIAQPSTKTARIDKPQIMITHLGYWEYPHAMPSKTSFNTMTQRTSWPHLLSLILFTKDIVQYNIGTETKEIIYANPVAPLRQALYHAFNNCTDLEPVYEDYKVTQLESITQSKGSLEELDLKYENLQAEFKELRYDESQIKKQSERYIQAKEELETAKYQMNKDADKARASQNELHARKLLKPTAELAALTSEVDKLKQILDKQGLPKTELKNLFRRLKHDMEQITFEQDERAMQLNDEKDLGIQLNQKLQQLKLDLEKFNIPIDPDLPLSQMSSQILEKISQAQRTHEDLTEQKIHVNDQAIEVRTKYTQLSNDVDELKDEVIYYKKQREESIKKKKVDDNVEYQALCEKEKKLYQKLKSHIEAVREKDKEIARLDEVQQELDIELKKESEARHYRIIEKTERVLKWMKDFEKDMENLVQIMASDVQHFQKDMKEKYNINL